MQEKQELWVQSLGWEDALEEEMATHSSILAWRIPWTEEPGGLQSVGLQRVRHDWVTELMDHSPPGSSVHGILQARILEWVAMPFLRGSSQPREPWSPVLKTDSLPAEPPGKPLDRVPGVI